MKEKEEREDGGFGYWVGLRRDTFDSDIRHWENFPFKTFIHYP